MSQFRISRHMMITYSLTYSPRVDRYMYSRWCFISENGDIFPSAVIPSRSIAIYTWKIANWAHLRHTDCRKLQRTADLNRIVARLENVIYLHPLFLPSLANLLENDIYVTGPVLLSQTENERRLKKSFQQTTVKGD